MSVIKTTKGVRRKNWNSAAQLAKAMGVSKSTICRQIKAGKIYGHRYQDKRHNRNHWFIQTYKEAVVRSKAGNSTVNKKTHEGIHHHRLHKGLQRVLGGKKVQGESGKRDKVVIVIITIKN